MSWGRYKRCPTILGFTVVSSEELELAYLAGLICADGHIRDRDKMITSYLGTSRYVGVVKKLLERYSLRKACVRRHHGVFEVYVTDKNLARIFIKKYEIPVGRKYDKITLPPLTNIEKRYFIAGFFDGDGSIYTRIHSEKR